MSAYRIVQESLTNTVKHARARSAEVSVRHCGHVLDIEVRDDGRGAVDGYAIGRGLLGITERVSLFGGTVEHGAGTVEHRAGSQHGDGAQGRAGGERGGFRVHAVLPIPR
jgi:glucose-6-phosphate-specific signal transduction histidine kinase